VTAIEISCVDIFGYLIMPYLSFENVAAIAATNRFSIATRDVSPFQTAGLNIINPWNDKKNSGRTPHLNESY
jgi:hypothetical protein